VHAPILVGSGIAASAPCWAAAFSLCCLVLITIWVTPGNRFAKRQLRNLPVLLQDFQGPQMGSSFSRVESVQIACIGPRTANRANLLGGRPLALTPLQAYDPRIQSCAEAGKEDL